MNSDYTIRETGSGKWLVIGKNDKIEYTSCEEDASTFNFSLESNARYYGFEWLLEKGCLEQNVPVYRLFNEDRALGQNQYACRYIDGRNGYENCGSGLRWKNLDSGNYHNYRIHRDDYEEFHRRVREYRVTEGNW